MPFNRRLTPTLSLLFVLVAMLTACQTTPPQEVQAAPVEAESSQENATPQESTPDLATAKVVSALSNQPGRTIVSARGNHFVVDSVPPLEGPNEEMNPLDALLAAQATCGTFIYETAAQEMGIPLNSIATTVQADFNPAGVKDGSVDPRIQAMRIHMTVEGPSPEQLAALADEFKTRCPVYTTLSRATEIEITHNEEAMSEATEGLATTTAVSTLSNQPGRAIVSARGNHFVIDSVPPLGGPNEERNPMDLLLGALATCGTFVYEKAALEMEMPLDSIVATVQGDFNPAGLKDGAVDPRLQAIRVDMAVPGVDAAQAETLAEQFQARCPIYTTLSRSAPIEITNSLQ